MYRKTLIVLLAVAAIVVLWAWLLPASLDAAPTPGTEGHCIVPSPVTAPCIGWTH
jgi:hypothetical protein